MIRSIIYYSSAAVFLAGLIVVQLNPEWIWVIVPLVLIYSLWTFRLRSRKQFNQNWHLWLGYCLFITSSFLQFLIFNGSAPRQVFSFIYVAIWLWLLFSTAYYLSHERSFNAKQFLEINQFIHFINLWQIASFLYFSLVFIQLSFWLTISLFALMVIATTYQMISLQGLRKGSKFLVLIAVTLTTMELFIAVNLLPLYFYLQASLITLWFFFVMQLTLLGQEVSSRRQIFFRYLIFLLVAVTVLILTI